ncbi:MAG: DUF92 domain-containing protein [Thermoplasmatota archaeon]
MQELVYPAVVVALCLLLAGLTYHRKVLDLQGAVLGFFLALAIGLFGHLLWLVLLLVFLVTAFVATRYKYALKEKMGVAEPKGGARGFASVLANGWVPMMVAVLSFENSWVSTFPKSVAAVLYLTALSAAASDTIASEIGVLSDRVYLITDFSRVRPGTNGGVSALGTTAALVAACYTSITGWLVIWFSGALSGFPLHFVLIPVIMGFTGCHIDSLLGATLENRGKLNKDRVNVLSIGAATLLALAVLMVV